MASLAPIAERPPRWFENVAVRQGLKMAIAGMLAFYYALWQHLGSPGWCIFTVVVLTLAQYVGAIAEKSVLRGIGTVVGALLGIWLVGCHGDQPLFVMAGCFVVAAFGTAMFGGNFYPYAFFLSALTMIVVVNDTMTDPSQVWRIGSARVEEIGVGIVASMVVTSVLWPRYARVEFRKNFRSALRDAGRIAISRGRMLLECDASGAMEPEIQKLEISFSTRMNALRLLVRYGQRESQYFRARLPIGMRMIGELGACFEAAVSLGQRLPSKSRYRDLVAGELQNIHEQLEREFDELSTRDDLSKINADFQSAFDECDRRLLEVREQGATKSIPLQEAMDFSAHYVALRDLAERLRVLRECLWEIHALREVITPPGSAGKPAVFQLDSYWIRNGIKGGITATLALLYVNWLNPPGGATLPFAAWLCTAMSRMYPGGEGDRRTFTYVIRVAVAGLVYAALLFVITPFLSDYFAMNMFLLIGLFLLGYVIASQGGISLYAQCGMLFFVGTISMNPQNPVDAQAIFNCYFGVVLALILSSLVQRLLWPLLPQREICRLFAEYFACCRALLGKVDEKESSRLQDRIALIPPEAAAWINVTTTPEYPKGESKRLIDLLHCAQRLGYSILSARKRAQLEIPAELWKPLAADVDFIEKACQEALLKLEEAFTSGHRGTMPASQLDIFQRLEEPLRSLRQRYLAGEVTFPQAIPFLGAMDFFENSARKIDQCAAQLGNLSLEKYSGDYAL
ncbi:MAG: FUSC family protein [Chthoniobacterales bacterium]